MLDCSAQWPSCANCCHSSVQFRHVDINNCVHIHLHVSHTHTCTPCIIMKEKARSRNVACMLLLSCSLQLAQHKTARRAERARAETLSVSIYTAHTQTPAVWRMAHVIAICTVHASLTVFAPATPISWTPHDSPRPVLARVPGSAHAPGYAAAPLVCFLVTGRAAPALVVVNVILIAATLRTANARAL